MGRKGNGEKRRRRRVEGIEEGEKREVEGTGGEEKKRSIGKWGRRGVNEI